MLFPEFGILFVSRVAQKFQGNQEQFGGIVKWPKLKFSSKNLKNANFLVLFGTHTSAARADFPGGDSQSPETHL